jgi:RHS repeat-associated protein
MPHRHLHKKVILIPFPSKYFSLSSLHTAKNHIIYLIFTPPNSSMTGEKYRCRANKYRYGFNGKEKDDEGMGGGAQTYDYGFRIYNTSLAKFLSVDPLLSKFAMLTPYQYASNTPIAAIDLDGLEARIITYEWCNGENVVSTHVELTIDIVIINNSSQSQSDVMGLYSDLKPMLDASFSGEQFDRAILNITYLGPADAEKLYVQASNDHKKVIYVEIRDSWNETDKARISKAGQAPESTPGYTVEAGNPKVNLIKLINNPGKSRIARLRTALHELGHMLGLTHPDNVDDGIEAVKMGDPNAEGRETCSPASGENMDNLMNQSSFVEKNGGDSASATSTTEKQKNWVKKLLVKKKQTETYSGGS